MNSARSWGLLGGRAAFACLCAVEAGAESVAVAGATRVAFSIKACFPHLAEEEAYPQWTPLPLRACPALR